jgi:hypothetical protein
LPVSLRIPSSSSQIMGFPIFIFNGLA